MKFLNRRIRQRASYRGYTVIEMVMVLAITGILLAIGVPNFNESTARSQVVGAAEGIFGMVLQAKAESAIRDADLSFNSNAGSAPWCVGYSVTPDCDCTVASSCVVDVAGTNVLQTLSGDIYPGVTMTENFATGGGTTFSRIRGSASQAGIVSVSSDIWQLDIVVSADGHTRICNPNDTTNSIAGYGAC